MAQQRAGRIRNVAAAVAAALVVALAISLPVAAPRPAEAVVPTPTGNNAVITVDVGGDRVGTASVGPLAGVQLGLYASATAADPVDLVWGVCTSDGDGDCSFIVPNTARNAAGTACAAGVTGTNCDRRFWVRQISAPAGWTMNPNLRTGDNAGNNSVQTPYRFQTGTQLRAGQTYSSDNQFMLGTGGTTNIASGGIWQQSRVNPPLPERCGLNIALILDLSLSIAQGGNLDALKEAADTFTDALTGTPSRMALFSFGYVSPSRYDQPNNPDLMPVSTAAGATAFKEQYEDWIAPGSTNWDNGMFVASLAASFPGTTNHYDAAIVLTDGNPTAYGNLENPAPPPGNANGVGEGALQFNRLREIENGIFSANAIKSHETRVLAVGVGTGSAGPITALNLQAISGPEAFDPSNPNPHTADYYQLDDYEVAGQALRSLVFDNCTPTLSVVKQIVPPGTTGEDIAGADNAGAGWTFDGAASDPGVTGFENDLTTIDDGTGAVNFPLDFADGVESTEVTIHETQHPGHELVTQQTQNAVCTEKSAENPEGIRIDVTPDEPDAEHPGFTFTMRANTAVSCVLYNRAPEPIAELTVFKSWVINGVPTAQGAQPTEIGAVLMRMNEGDTTPTNIGWGATQPGYLAGDVVNLSEGVFFGQDLCELESSTVTEVNGAPPTVTEFASVVNALPTAADTDYAVTLEAGSNTVSVLNVVTCQSQLFLYKLVEGGTAPLELWDLSAIAPPGALPGPAGESGVNAFVTPGVTYQLAETADYDENPEAALYVQVDRRTDFQSNPLSTGSMICQLVLADGITPISGTIDGLNGGATVPIGARMACIAVNQTATLHLRKVVDNSNGGTAEPSDWSITVEPVGPLPLPPGIGPITVPGTDAELGATFNVRPGIQYDITESEPPDAPPGYRLTDVTCELLNTGARVIETLDPLDADLCTFTNTYAASILTLEKEVVNDHGGTAEATDWTLSAVGAADTLEGVTGSEAVTGVLVEPGEYELSESGGPSGYSASAWSCDGGTLEGTTVTVPLGGDVTCRIVNDDTPPRWTVEKSSDPASGTEVAPGSTVVYTITATSLGDGFGPPSDLTIVDDLSEVLNHASFMAGSISPSTGSASLSGTTLTWRIPTLTGTATLQYRVIIADDARGVTIRNVVTADGAEPCPPDREDCLTTTHRTPSPPLADTGVTTGPLGLVALGVLLAGAAAVLLARRRTV